MAIHLGWYGNLSMSSSDVSTYTDDTAMDVLMLFGFRGLADWSTYRTAVNSALSNIISSNDVKLLLELPAYALNYVKNNGGDTSLIEEIGDEYDDEPKVWGYYIEEPNYHGWDEDVVSDAVTVLGKQTVVNLQSGGVSQQTVNDYASGTAAGFIGGFMYPLIWNDPNEWENIEKLVDPNDSNEILLKLRDNSYGGAPFHTKFWFGLQAFDGETFDPAQSQRPPIVKTWEDADPDGEPDTWAQNNPKTSPEFIWMLHRAIYEGADGCLFFAFYRAGIDASSKTNLRQAVRNIFDLMGDESAHHALSTTPKATSDDSSTDWVRVIEPSTPDDHILYSYHYYGGSYWLLVMDKYPERTGDPYPIDLRIQCNIPLIYDDFVTINQRYGVTQKNDGRGTTIPSSIPSPQPDKFREFWADYNGTYSYELGLRRGEVKLYRFL